MCQWILQSTMEQNEHQEEHVKREKITNKTRRLCSIAPLALCGHQTHTHTNPYVYAHIRA